MCVFFRHHGARVKKSSEKEEEPKIIACKHSEIKHDSIMIWYIDIEMNDERNKTAKKTLTHSTRANEEKKKVAEIWRKVDVIRQKNRAI